MLSYGGSTFTSSGALTVQACTTDQCVSGMDVCTAATCNGRGECDVSPSNTAVCTCVSAYNGTNCEIAMGCNIQCVNGGTVDTGSCACDCPAGFNGSAVRAGVCQHHRHTVAGPVDRHVLRQRRCLPARIRHRRGPTHSACGPNAVVIQSVGTTSEGNHTLVSFQLTSMSSPDALQVYADLLASLQSKNLESTLSSGLTTADVTSVAIVAGPPSTDSGSSPSVISKYWPYIVGGIVGFSLIFCILYCANGGRCAGCREQRAEPNMSRIVGPKGSGSMTRQGQVVVGGGGGHAQNKHERRPTHEARHSYFQGKPAAV